MNKFMGKKVRDKITRFEGIVTGYVEYISGCNQMLVAPIAKGDGSMIDSAWIDEQRIEIIDLKAKALTLDNENHPGPDKSAPRR